MIALLELAKSCFGERAVLESSVDSQGRRHPITVEVDDVEYSVTEEKMREAIEKFPDDIERRKKCFPSKKRNG